MFHSVTPGGVVAISAESHLAARKWTADSHLAARTWTCLGPRCSRACRTAADGTRSPKQSVSAPLETAAEWLRQRQRQTCAQDNTRERRHATHETPSIGVEFPAPIDGSGLSHRRCSVTVVCSGARRCVGRRRGALRPRGASIDRTRARVVHSVYNCAPPFTVNAKRRCVNRCDR